MKKMLLLLLIIPILSIAQTKERLSRAYLGVMLHNFDYPGISLVNSFGINRYLGVGAGVDFTKFKDEVMAPVYIDTRINVPINRITPFATIQLGYQLYNGSVPWGGATGLQTKAKMRGKYFYGAGAGLGFNAAKIGFYLSYTQRAYYFKYDKMEINGRDFTPENPENVGVLGLGMIF